MVSPGKTSDKYCFNFTKKKRERDFSSIDPIKKPKKRGREERKDRGEKKKGKIKIGKIRTEKNKDRKIKTEK